MRRSSVKRPRLERLQVLPKNSMQQTVRCAPLLMLGVRPISNMPKWLIAKQHVVILRRGIMLRILAYLFFTIAALELLTVTFGKLDALPGVLAAATSVFFGGVLYGFAIVCEHLKALREQFTRSDQVNAASPHQGKMM